MGFACGPSVVMRLLLSGTRHTVRRQRAIPGAVRFALAPVRFQREPDAGFRWWRGSGRAPPSC